MRYVVASYLFPAGADSEAAKEKARRALNAGFAQASDTSAARNALLLEMLAAQTLRACETKNLLARKPEVDFLLRLAGTTQIARAIGEVGSKKGKGFILVIASPERFSYEAGPSAKRLAAHALSPTESDRVEVAALLNALRA